MKGLRLTAVGKGDQANHLRPTTDRIRETLFNILANRIDFDGLSVLDLFAGTGALGLEALSRGAGNVTFVESGRAAQKLLTSNISLTSQEDQIRLLKTDATRLPAGTPHDLVFMDPPYGKQMGEKAIRNAISNGWLAPNAMLVWEENTAPDFPPEIQLVDQRKLGGTILSLGELI